MRSLGIVSCASLIAALTTLLACGGGEGTSGSGGSGASTGAGGTTTSMGTGTGGTGTGGTTMSTGTGTGGTGTGGTGTGGTGTDVLLTNNDTTCVKDSIGPAPGEEKHLAAERLTPPSYPFVVTAVRYVLAADDQCDPGLAHTVDVFAASTVAPPATPNVLRHFDNPTTAVPKVDRTVTLELEPPVTLASGEHLFVAVSMGGTSPSPIVCVSTCGGPAAQEDRNYWSNADAPPYPWPTLASFGFDRNYAFDALGHPE